jgi:hypothetical protein
MTTEVADTILAADADAPRMWSQGEIEELCYQIVAHRARQIEIGHRLQRRAAVAALQATQDVEAATRRHEAAAVLRRLAWERQYPNGPAYNEPFHGEQAQRLVDELQAGGRASDNGHGDGHDG